MINIISPSQEAEDAAKAKDMVRARRIIHSPRNSGDLAINIVAVKLIISPIKIDVNIYNTRILP